MRSTKVPNRIVIIAMKLTRNASDPNLSSPDFSKKVSFSRNPKTEFPTARTQTKTPKKMCHGSKSLLRVDDPPGKKQIIKLYSHCKVFFFKLHLLGFKRLFFNFKKFLSLFYLESVKDNDTNTNPRMDGIEIWDVFLVMVLESSIDSQDSKNNGDCVENKVDQFVHSFLKWKRFVTYNC